MFLVLKFPEKESLGLEVSFKAESIAFADNINSILESIYVFNYQIGLCTDVKTVLHPPLQHYFS